MANTKSGEGKSKSTQTVKSKSKSGSSESSGTNRKGAFSLATVRIMGAVLMFVGLMLCVMLNSMMSLFVTVVALLALVMGFYLTASGIRTLAARNHQSTKHTAAVWLIVGILLLAMGVVALIYRGAIASWVLVFVGALIAIFGLVMLIMLAVAQRGPKKTIFDVVISVLTMAVGVLIALLVLPAVGNAVNHLCYYLFGALAIAIGGTELVMY